MYEEARYNCQTIMNENNYLMQESNEIYKQSLLLVPNNKLYNQSTLKKIKNNILYFKKISKYFSYFTFPQLE